MTCIKTVLLCSKVVTRDIHNSAVPDVADVYSQTSLSQVQSLTVYSVYNDSDGKSCGECEVVKEP